MSKRSGHIPLVWLVSLVLFADTTFADQHGSNPPQLIEVFKSYKHPMIDTDAKGSGGNLRMPEITVYEIDGIQFVERELSFKLPAEPQQAKQIALRRIQSLDEQARSRMHSAAMALAKAIQYGVNRYPAVVFDGEAVVYGITELTVALERYRAWETGRRP